MHTKVAYDAKIVEFIEKSLLSIEKLYNKSLHKSRLEFFKLVIPAIICAKSVQYQAIGAEMEGDIEERSKARRVYNFITQYELDYEFISYFLLLLLPKKGKLTLCLDRTEWDFGSSTHNILTVTVYSHGVGVPIWFECVAPKGGCCDADDKQYVIMKCVELVGKERIKRVIGDSEFIGETWISYLFEEGISFFFDVRGNQYFEYNGEKKKIIEWMQGRYKLELKGVKIFGKRLNIGILRQKKSEKVKRKAFLAIVTNCKQTDGILSVYKNRWSIEVFFQSLKGRGFNLEMTHTSDAVEMLKLFALLCMAFLLSFIVGLEIDKVIPIPVKNHGYKANSFFRTGRDFIRQVFSKKSIIPKIEVIFEALIILFETIIKRFYATLNSNILENKSFVT
jgi:Transposase DDE domain